MTDIPDELRGKTPEQLLEYVETLDARLRWLHQGVDGQIRAKTSAEQFEFDNGLLLRDTADKLITQHANIRKQFDRSGAEIAGAPQHMTRVMPFDDDVMRLSDDQVRDRALKALETRGKHLDSGQQDQLDMLLRAKISEQSPNVNGTYVAKRMLITESDDYRSAFAQFINAGLRGRTPVLTGPEAEAFRALEALDAAEFRGMSEGSVAAGLAGVPVTIDPSIVLTAQQSGTELLRISRNEVITTNKWKGVSSSGMTWSFDAEGAVVSDDSPSLAQPEVPVGMARGWVEYTIELGQDYPAFVSELQTVLLEGYNELLAENLIQGAGTNNGPTGIATALEANTNVQVILTTASTFPVTDVYKMWDALPKRARRQSTWLSSQNTQNLVRQFGAATAGTADANFTVDLQQGMIQRLFGREYVVDDFMDDKPAAGTTAASFLIAGRFDRFLIARRAGMAVEPVAHVFDTTTGRPTGKRGLFAWARIGSDSIDDTAFRVLVNKTS